MEVYAIDWIDVGVSDIFADINAAYLSVLDYFMESALMRRGSTEEIITNLSENVHDILANDYVEDLVCISPATYHP